MEQGFPDLVVRIVGLAVKSGTSNDIVARLNAAINKALATPRVREASPSSVPSRRAERRKVMATVSSQLAHWTKVVEASGMKMQQ